MSVRLCRQLSFDATADDLREIFGQCGEVEDAIIVTRPGGGRPRVSVLSQLPKNPQAKKPFASSMAKRSLDASSWLTSPKSVKKAIVQVIANRFEQGAHSTNVQ